MIFTRIIECKGGRKMKKVIGLILVLITMMAFTVPVMAEDVSEDPYIYTHTRHTPTEWGEKAHQADKDSKSAAEAQQRLQEWLNAYRDSLIASITTQSSGPDCSGTGLHEIVITYRERHFGYAAINDCAVYRTTTYLCINCPYSFSREEHMYNHDYSDHVGI